MYRIDQRISLRRKHITTFVRSRLILLEDVENDLREVKMKRWRKMGKNTVEYASLVTQAKILRENTSQGVSTCGDIVTEDFFKK
jgi:hypothetical protein